MVLLLGLKMFLVVVVVTVWVWLVVVVAVWFWLLVEVVIWVVTVLEKFETVGDGVDVCNDEEEELVTFPPDTSVKGKAGVFYRTHKLSEAFRF